LATHKRLFLVLFEVDGLRPDKSAKVFLRFYAIAVYFDAKTKTRSINGMVRPCSCRNVAFGSKADIASRPHHARFTLTKERPLRADAERVADNQHPDHRHRIDRGRGYKSMLGAQSRARRARTRKQWEGATTT